MQGVAVRYGPEGNGAYRAGFYDQRVTIPPLRAMNSYYTNKIEGQHTLPTDIERAIRREFDADLELRRK